MSVGCGNHFVRLGDDHWVTFNSITGWNLALAICTPVLVLGITLALPRVKKLFSLPDER